MLLTEFFNQPEGDSYANYQATSKATQNKRPQTQTNNIVNEDSWSGPGNSWHDQGQPDQWYDGRDQWHNQDMAEDFAVANLITTEDASMSDIVQARELIGSALRDPLNEKHKYFEFLKHLRTKHGADYSTKVHQKASKLAREKA